MTPQPAKLRRRLISTVFAATVIAGAAGTSRAMAAEPNDPPRQAPATPAAAARQAPVQPVPAPPTARPEPAQQRDHRHDHDGDRRGPIVVLPWCGNLTGPEGWTGWEGWTSNTNTGNNNSTFSDTSVPNLPPQPPATMPSTPSAAGTAAAITNSIDKSPEMVAANNDVQQAQLEYDKQRERVVAQLGNNPEYTKAVEHRDAAAKDLNTAKSTATTQPAVAEAASAKLDASSDVTRMQEQAITADKDAAAAKTHLAEVVAKRDALRAKMLTQH